MCGADVPPPLAPQKARDDTGAKRLSGGDEFSVALHGPAAGAAAAAGPPPACLPSAALELPTWALTLKARLRCPRPLVPPFWTQ